MTTSAELRLNRFLARAGLGSRRGVEDLIAAGRVRVNGVVVQEPGRRVDPEQDHVLCDGTEVRLPIEWRVLAYHKPRGVVCSLRRQDERPCLADVRRESGLGEGLVPVGRLDAETSGLLLWTDDGALAERLMLPGHGIWKRYEVGLDRPLPRDGERQVREGAIELDGRLCLPARLEPLDGSRRAWRYELHEGRNRQIRRVFLTMGCRVTALHRSAVGPVELGDLEPGRFRELGADDVAALRGSLAEPTD